MPSVVSDREIKPQTYRVTQGSTVGLDEDLHPLDLMGAGSISGMMQASLGANLVFVSTSTSASTSSQLLSGLGEFAITAANPLATQPQFRAYCDLLASNVRTTEQYPPAVILYERHFTADHNEFRSSTTRALPESLQGNWLALAQSGLSNESFARLRSLASKKDGWRGVGSKALGGISISKFLNFWTAVKDFAVEPELMLTPMGTLQAEWFKSHRQFLEIEFPNDGKSVNFGLIDGDERLEGIVDQKTIINALKGRKDRSPLAWGGC